MRVVDSRVDTLAVASLEPRGAHAATCATRLPSVADRVAGAATPGVALGVDAATRTHGRAPRADTAATVTPLPAGAARPARAAMAAIGHEIDAERGGSRRPTRHLGPSADRLTAAIDARLSELTAQAAAAAMGVVGVDPLAAPTTIHEAGLALGGHVTAPLPTHVAVRTRHATRATVGGGGLRIHAGLTAARSRGVALEGFRSGVRLISDALAAIFAPSRRSRIRSRPGRSCVLSELEAVDSAAK